MALSHKVVRITGTPFALKYLIYWQNITKDVQFRHSKPDYEEVIWEAFKRGVEAERDRLYAIMGKWPPYDKEEVKKKENR